MSTDPLKYKTTTRVAVYAFLLTGWLAWPGEVAAQAPASSTDTVSIHQGKLHVHLVNVPLGQVLSQIQDLTHIPVFIDPQMAKTLVTEDMTGFPLEKGLSRLLKGRTYTFTFSGNREGGPEGLEGLLAIHVFAPSRPIIGKAQTPNPTRPSPLYEEAGITPVLFSPSSSQGNDAAGTFFKKHPPYENFQNLEEDELKDIVLKSQDSSAKLAALEELADRQQSQEFLPVLASSLQDFDPGIREFTLELLENLETVPWDLITEVAMNDPSPHLRVEALDVLTQAERQVFPVDAVGRITLDDQEPSIRLAGLELLADYVTFDNPDLGTLTTVEEILSQSLLDPLPEIRDEAQYILEKL
jgi:hypothetical protein